MSDDYVRSIEITLVAAEHVCFKCGTCVQPDQKHCHQCGTQNPTIHEKQCRKCSYMIIRLSGWMYFCPICGTPIVYERCFSVFDRLKLLDRIEWYKNPLNWGLSDRAADQLVRYGITPDHALLMRKGDFMMFRGIGEKIATEVMAKRKYMP